MADNPASVEPVAWTFTDSLGCGYLFIDEKHARQAAAQAGCDLKPLYSAATVAALHARIAELEGALRPASEAGVKPLEWRGQYGLDWWAADAIFGRRYAISHYPGAQEPFVIAADWIAGPVQEFRTLEEAKAAAQADYAQRIRSALLAADNGYARGVEGDLIERAKRMIGGGSTFDEEDREDIARNILALVMPAPPSTRSE